MNHPTHYNGIPILHLPHGTVKLNTDKELTVLFCPDTHFPFQHPDTFRFLKYLKDEYRPDVFVHAGDEVDFAALSFHEKDPHMPSAAEEYKCAVDQMHKLYQLFPNALVATSNHTSRVFRVAFKAGLPSQMLRTYREFLEAPPGWSWHDRILINDVAYFHGDPLSGPNAPKQWMAQLRMSICQGHLHSNAGVGYSQGPFNQSFWMNAGCLIDLESMAFRYGAKYANKGTLGAGIIIGGHTAYFIPMR